MTTIDDIETLTLWAADGRPVVSLYLSLTDGGSYPVRADALIDRAWATLPARGLDAPTTQGVRTDLDHIAAFLRSEDGPSDGVRSLAVFACGARALWRVCELADPVEDRIIVAARPYVRPLAYALEPEPRYAIALIDIDRARFLLLDQGKVVLQKDWRSDTAARNGAGNRYYEAPESFGERPAAERLHHHLKEAARLLDAWLQRLSITRLLLAGERDHVAAFRRTLPRAVRERVVGVLEDVGSWSMETLGPLAREAMRTAERAWAEALACETLAEIDRHGGHAVAGIDQILSALFHDAVQTLLVQRDLEAPGYVCRRCGRLLSAGGGCPECGGVVLIPVPDVIEEAIAATYREGGEVTFIEPPSDPAASVGASPAAEWLRRGGIGGLLRFVTDGDSASPASAAPPSASVAA